MKKFNMFITLLIASLSIHAQTEKYAKMTEVDIQIVENNTVIHTINLLLLDGNPATVSFTEELTNKPMDKIDITSSKVRKDSKELINVEIDYAIFKDYEWVSKFKPTVLTKPDSEAMVSISNELDTLEIFVTAKSRDNEILASDPLVSSLGLCKTEIKSSTNCCTKACTDGTKGKMKCCGSATCSACGTSCTPSTSGTID